MSEERKGPATAVLVLFIVFVVAGIGLPAAVIWNAEGRGKKDEPAADRLTSAERGHRWIEVSEVRVAKGKTAFAACAGCHGPLGEGQPGVGPRLVSESFLAAASDDLLVETIRGGRPGTTMIPWGSTLDDDTVQSLVAYLRSLAPVEAVQLDESKLSGDLTHGKALYSSICASCHGARGGGYAETGNGTGIGRAGFLNVASDGFLRHIVRHGKSQTAMKGFSQGDTITALANLSKQEIDDAIAYLRSQAW